MNQNYPIKHHSKTPPQRRGVTALLLAFAACAHAGPRTSADYTVPADTADAGGQRATSASYTNDGSLGGIVGISSAGPAVAKTGYIGQLTEVTALQLAATPTTVDETATRQLNAAPLLDPDGDGQNNAFEFTAGLIPTDPLSRFNLTIAAVPGQPGQKDIVFDPIVVGRTYTVMTSPDLSPGSWDPLVGGNASDDGDHRTVTDSAAIETRKFYTVEIVQP